MCGFAFIYAPSIPLQAATQQMESCLQALRHRGPDDGHVLQAAGAVLGHRRLSIIDLAGSTQPMVDPSGRYFLTYNGEIYNYKEVRHALESRWTFVTQGDTEVLLAGLVLEGESFLGRLEGMWAFALWDAHTQQVLLGRDRLGKKPLFFQRLQGAGLACASELPALRKLSTEAWSEDEDSTADYLRYGYNLPGYTAYREVRELLPGHTSRWNVQNGQLTTQQYWQLQPGSFAGSRQDGAEQLHAALVAAVRRRMVADVEVGAFLSGGIDSSLICAIVRRELGEPLKTFTIGFDEAAFDERPFARLVAQVLGTEHHEEVLAHWDEGALERLMLEHVGQPFADSSLLPTHLVSQVAARHVKVALSGDGGDELFCGYQRYQARTLWRWYSRLPAPLRRIAEQGVRALPEPMVHHSRSLLKKAHLFMDIAARQEAEWPYFAPLMFTPDDIQVLAPALRGRGHQPPGIPQETDLDDLQRMMVADALIYLPQAILTKVDRASMACSLEVRAPFLDRSVVELAFSMPSEWHRHGFAGKRMLNTSFSGLLPGSIWQRRKQGFSSPLQEWFRGPLEQQMCSLLAADPGPFRADAVHDLLAQHRARSRDHGYRLWLIFNYLRWRHNAL